MSDANNTTVPETNKPQIAEETAQASKGKGPAQAQDVSLMEDDDSSSDEEEQVSIRSDTFE